MSLKALYHQLTWLLRYAPFFFLQGLTDRLAPNSSVRASEVRSAKKIRGDFPEFDDLLAQTYNCLAGYEHLFEGRIFGSLTPRELASIKLIGRIATAYYRMAENIRNGYGWEACSVGASLFELCWLARKIAHDDSLASQWLTQQRAPKVKPTVQEALRLEGCADYLAQTEIEYSVYSKLCDFKHGNPTHLTTHAPRDWAEWGTMRMGPDTTPAGMYALCFALDIGSFLALGALERFTRILHGTTAQELLRAIQTTTENRQRIHERLNALFRSET